MTEYMVQDQDLDTKPKQQKKKATIRPVALLYGISLCFCFDLVNIWLSCACVLSHSSLVATGSALHL